MSQVALYRRTAAVVLHPIYRAANLAARAGCHPDPPRCYRRGWPRWRLWMTGWEDGRFVRLMLIEPLQTPAEHRLWREGVPEPAFYEDEFA